MQKRFQGRKNKSFTATKIVRLHWSTLFIIETTSLRVQRYHTYKYSTLILGYHSGQTVTNALSSSMVSNGEPSCNSILQAKIQGSRLSSLCASLHSRISFLHFVGVGMKLLVSLAVLAVVILTESLYSWRSCRKRRSTARLYIRHDNKSMFIADIRLGSTVICEFPNILALIFFDYLNVNLFMTNWCKIYCMMLD